MIALEDVTVSFKTLKDQDITLKEFLCLLWHGYGFDIEDFRKTLKESALFSLAYEDKVSTMLTAGRDKLLACLTETNSPKFHSEEEYDNLAMKLKEIYIKRKNNSERTPAQEGMSVIKNRLKILEQKKMGVKLDFDKVVKATQLYVNENRDNPYIRTLGYFIFKDAKGADGIEKKSDLEMYMDLVDSNDVEVKQESVTNVFV